MSPYGHKVGQRYVFSDAEGLVLRECRFDGLTEAGEYQVTFLDGKQETTTVDPLRLQEPTTIAVHPPKVAPDLGDRKSRAHRMGKGKLTKPRKPRKRKDK